MPHYVPLQPSVHRHAGFQRAQDVYHAAHDRFAPLLLDELAQVLPYMPLCFIPHTGDSTRFQLVGLQGLHDNQNLFLHPKSHKWLVGYTPACYRAYPFGLVTDDNTGKQVLGFDMNSGLLRESLDAPRAVAFFDENNQPAQTLKDTLAFLKALEEGKQRTQQAVDALAEQGLIQPWPVALQIGEEKETLAGLYRIDAEALQQLSDEALGKLNRVGALQLAYAQLFSQPQLKHLGKLASVHARAGDMAANDNLDELFGEGDDDFTFDFDS